MPSLSSVHTSLCLAEVHRNGWFTQERDKATHLLLDGGMLCIPEKTSRVRFNRLYAKDINRGEALFVVAMRPKGTDAPFPMFMDVDSGDVALTRDQALLLAGVIGEEVGGFFPYTSADAKGAAIATCPDTPNLHLHWPSLYVTQTDAVKLLCTLPAVVLRKLEELPAESRAPKFTLVQMKKCLDLSIVLDNGLRMIGSRKVQECPRCRGKGDVCAACRGIGKRDTGIGRVYRVTHLISEPGDKPVPAPVDLKYNTALQIDMCSVEGGGDYIACPFQIPVKYHAYRDVTREEKSLKRINVDGSCRATAQEVRKVLGGVRLSAVATALARMHQRYAGMKLATAKPTDVEQEFIINPVRKAENRYCQNIGRTHHNNGIYFIANFESGELVQRCRCQCPDKDCSTYNSPPTRLGGLRIGSSSSSLGGEGKPKKISRRVELAKSRKRACVVDPAKMHEKLDGVYGSARHRAMVEHLKSWLPSTETCSLVYRPRDDNPRRADVYLRPAAPLFSAMKRRRLEPVPWDQCTLIGEAAMVSEAEYKMLLEGHVHVSDLQEQIDAEVDRQIFVPPQANSRRLEVEGGAGSAMNE